MKIHEYFTLFLKKIKIVSLSSAKVITKYVFLYVVYRFGIAAQGKFMWEAEMQEEEKKRLSALL